MRVFFLSTTSPTFISHLSCISHSNRYEVVYYCSFDLDFPLAGEVEYFFIYVDYLYVFLREVSIQIFCLFLNVYKLKYFNQNG